MLKDTPNKHTLRYTKFSEKSLYPRDIPHGHLLVKCDMIPMKETNGDFLIHDSYEETLIHCQ